MNLNYRHSISTLLILSCGLLGILVPGGMAETRGFDHINPFILLAFNIFLTLLVVVSMIVIYHLYRNERWAFAIAAFCGLSYFLVYALDLAKMFPVSPDPMSHVLLTIEIIGTIISVPLVLLSVKEFSTAYDSQMYTSRRQLYSVNFIYFVSLLFIFGLGIIIFATKSAMGI